MGTPDMLGGKLGAGRAHPAVSAGEIVLPGQVGVQFGPV